jgi:hypothetical protein
MNGDAPNNSLSQEQIESVKQIINSTIDGFIATAIRNNQASIIESINTSVAKAITENQKIVAAPIQLDLGNSAKTDKEGNGWKIAGVILPVILTAILGFWVTSITNEASEKLKTNLAVTEQLYKRKIEIYEETHKQMRLLVDAFQNASINPQSVGKASESLKLLNQTYKINKLYISDEVAKELEELWKLGIEAPPLRPSGSVSTSQILTQVSKVADAMKRDLGVNERFEKRAEQSNSNKNGNSTGA